MLLEFIEGKTQYVQMRPIYNVLIIPKHPSYINQAKLIKIIEADYVGLRKKVNAGLSKRTMEDKFKEAKKKLYEF